MSADTPAGSDDWRPQDPPSHRTKVDARMRTSTLKRRAARTKPRSEEPPVRWRTRVRKRLIRLRPNAAPRPARPMSSQPTKWPRPKRAIPASDPPTTRARREVRT